MNIRSQQGVSLIEVLISVGVVSFGFVSVATLQIAGISNLTGSNQHFLASTIANSMADALRSNASQLVEYDGIDTDDFGVDCELDDCSLVEYDIWLWQGQLSEVTHNLPEARGVINLEGRNASVSISWMEKRANSQAVAMTYTLEVPME